MRTAAEHPKMAALLQLLLAHFGATSSGSHEAGDAPPGAHAGNGAGSVTAGGRPGDGAGAWAAGARSGGAEPSRVIIFTTLRETVGGICKALRPHAPLIKAKRVLSLRSPPESILACVRGRSHPDTCSCITLTL